jgi:HEAT repeat protein
MIRNTNEHFLRAMIALAAHCAESGPRTTARKARAFAKWLAREHGLNHHERGTLLNIAERFAKPLEPVPDDDVDPVVPEIVTRATRTGMLGGDASVGGGSIKCIEVLRDSAAAQYGSDAIAGVIVDRELVKDPTDVLAGLDNVYRNRPPANAETLRRSRPTHPPASSPEPRLTEQPRPPPARARALWMITGVAVVGLTAAVIAIGTAQTPNTAQVKVPGPGSTHIVAMASPPLPTDNVLRDKAEAAIRQLLADAEPSVRIDAADALTRIRALPSIPRLTEVAGRDPDERVRARIGYQLSVLGAKDTTPLLERLESAAAAPPKVWYTAALARLGDRRALKRLSRYARSKDLPVAIIACFALADIVAEIAQPGDSKIRDEAVAGLVALAAREAELVKYDPYAGIKILAKGAALRDRMAREQLYAVLEEKDPDVRFAAAATLARLGDDAGREVIRSVFADPSSPNRLGAAVALIALGEYAGLDLMIAKLADDDPAVRELAAGGLGEMGERAGLEQLVGADRDKNAHVRIAAAAAIVAIVGLAPQVLARASIDWTRNALDSQDWVVRRAAAGVLSDIPAKEAVPLLARAFADRNAEVRNQAARSAGKIRSRDSAEAVMAVVEQEVDPGVKEQQVKALGAIGDAVAHDVLERISATPGRMGVIAAGALIAVGDVTGLTRLETAVAAPQTELRLAAVEAASAASNPIVVPTLKIGLFDRVFQIRFTAAEGLAAFNAERAGAVPVLHAAVNSKDASLIGRALAALARFGAQLRGLARSPTDMVDSPDPRQRLAAVPAVRALSVAERVPLLRRLVADPDLEVRRAAVDAIEDVATKDKEPEHAVRLYRPLVRDPDPIVRSKASGQLSRWSPPPPPAGRRREVIPVRTLDQETKIEAGLKEKATEASLIAAEVTTTKLAVEKLAAEIEASISVDTPDEPELQRVKQLQRDLKEKQDKLEAAEKKTWVIATNAGDLAGTGVGAGATVAATLANVRRIASDTRTTREAVASKVVQIQTQADEFRKINTPDIQILLDRAKVLIDQDNIRAAGAKLAQAAKLAHRAGAKSPRLDELHAELYVRMARDAGDPAQKRAHLERAAEAYRRIVATSTGRRAQVASDHLDEIVQELDSSVQP